MVVNASGYIISQENLQVFSDYFVESCFVENHFVESLDDAYFSPGAV